MPKVIKLAIAALLITAAPAWAQVKAFALEHCLALMTSSEQLQEAMMNYAGIIEAHGGDYAAAWVADGPKLARTVDASSTRRLAASRVTE